MNFDQRRNSLRLDTVSATLLYVGEADFGSAETASNWRIKRLITTGTVLKIDYADGNERYDNVWTDRATLSYS